MGYFISLLEYFIGIGFIFFLHFHFHFHFHSHSHFSSPFCKLTAERVGFIFSHYQIGVFFLITLGQAWTDGWWWVGEQLENLEWIRGKVFFSSYSSYYCSPRRESSSFSFYYSLLGISGPFLAFIGIWEILGFFIPILFFYLPFFHFIWSFIAFLSFV